ncbi:MAG: autotransporter outer membrane beta-barrel domain-containing protein [bacterium]|nr:autotransporter outer membrane beta-barrel domain-containing protein [bacterium]
MTQKPPLDRDGACREPASPERPPSSGRASAVTRPLLLGLALASAFWLLAPRAEAACDPDTPPLADGGSVTCTGTDETGFDASGNTDVTITTSGTVVIDDSGAEDAGIVVGDGNTIVLGADSTLDVVDVDGVGLLGQDDNIVTLDGTINVGVVNGAGVRMRDNTETDGPPAPVLGEITHNGMINVGQDGAVGIDVRNNYEVINSEGATITVETGADGGVGIRGVDDNVITNLGTIVVDADDAFAIQVNENTGGALPNGVIGGDPSLGVNGTITINGDRATAIAVGDNTGTILGNTQLNGIDGRGLLAGDKSDPDAEANHTNVGDLEVTGDGSIGMELGDGWITVTRDGTTNEITNIANDVVNRGSIDVSGANAFGVCVGDDANVDNDSFVINESGATISVTGTDSVGVSLGGNEILDGADDTVADYFSFGNAGTVSGDEDAGPLVEFRSFSGTFENRIFNTSRGVISADPTNAGTANRGIAILGTAGVEVIDNAGEIIGDVFLLGGEDFIDLTGDMTGTIDLGADDDTFRFATSASIGDGVTIDGGDGADDTFVLAFDDGSTPGALSNTFDLSRLANFERVQLEGSALVMGENTSIGWFVTEGGAFTGDLEVLSGSRLLAIGESQPAVLGGDLLIEPGGAVRVLVDGVAVPIRADGAATLGGDLEVVVASGLDEGTYGVVEAASAAGAFDSIELPDPVGLIAYSTVDTPTGLDLVITRVGTFGDPLVAFGANNQAIGAYLDAIDGDAGTSSELQTELNLIAGSNGSVSRILGALSPESYDAQSALVIEGGRRVARLLMERPRECNPGELDPWQGTDTPLECHAHAWAPWVSGIGAQRTREAFSGRPEYDAFLGGVVFGVDAPSMAGFDFTLAVSTQHGTVDYERFGEADLTLAEVSGYAGWSHGPLRVQTVATWAHTRHDSTRSITYSEGTGTGSVSQALNAEDEFDSSRLLLAAEVGLLFDVGPITVEPIAAVDWARVETDGLTESGAAPFNARIRSRDDDVLTTRTGLRLGTAYEYRRYLHRYLEWATGVWRPTLDLRWRQTHSGNQRDVRASLVGGPSGVAPFTVEAKEDAGGFEIGTGVSFSPKYVNRLQFQLRYDVYRASHTVDHDLSARIRIGF